MLLATVVFYIIILYYKYIDLHDCGFKMCLQY